jgi:hypothetical protein
MPAPSSPTSVAIAAKSLVAYVPGSSRLTHRGAARVTWTGVAGTTHRLEKQAGAGAWVFADLAADGFDYGIVADLVRGTTYKFRVRAENGDGVSAYVETATWTVPAIPTSAAAISLPTSLAAGNITARRATISWTDNSDNDSGFMLRLTPVGEPARLLYVAPLQASLVIGGLLPSTSYGIAVAPVGGRYDGLTRNGGYPLIGDFSADVQFSTDADAIQIVPVPPQNAYIGRAFSLKVQFSAGATAASISDFPAGLSLTFTTTNAFGVIEGTPDGTEPPGHFTGNVAADTDDVDVEVTLFQPTLVPLWRDTQVAGTLGVAFSHTIVATVQPSHTPPADAIAYEATGLPPWATIDTTGIITGTPNASGTWNVLASASSGVESCQASFSIVVPAAHITSANAKTVYVSQPFSVSLTATPAGAVFTTDSTLPVGVTLAANVLGGTPGAAGVFPIDLVATLGDSEATGDSQRFTLTVKELWEANALDTFVGEPVYQAVTFQGRGTKISWQLTGAPAGLVIEADTALCPAGKAAKITGTAAAGSEGFYDAVVSIQVKDVDGVVRIYRKTVTITVSGGLLLGWFHRDPEHRDLQVFPRTREVKSYYATPEATLWLKRGDDVRMHFVFRDGKSTLLDITEYTELRLTIRPTDQYDGEPYFTLGGVMGESELFDFEEINDHFTIFLQFEVTGDAIEERFRRLNEGGESDTTTRQISAIGEIEYIKFGYVRSTMTFPVIIAQDVAR